MDKDSAEKLKDEVVGLMKRTGAAPFSFNSEQRKRGRQAMALGLWQEWFDTDGDPYKEDGFYCFGCKRSKRSYHAEDCIYIRAKQLIEADHE